MRRHVFWSVPAVLLSSLLFLGCEQQGQDPLERERDANVEVTPQGEADVELSPQTTEPTDRSE